ncbi:MAG: sulfite exporter TauE/SafE family protein [Acidimicrobiales bacterium]
MPTLVVCVLAGVFGQLVDGALGMAFGVTASTVLLSNGVAPASTSAIVHFAKIGTAITSGASHWRFGNVSWPLVLRLGLPGAVGGFAGATFLSSVTADWLEPAVAVVLVGLGAVVVARSLRGHLDGGRPRTGSHRARALAPLGLGGGFLDAVGGGGWGPVATPTLLAAGRVEPRVVIGSVNAAELLVTLAASAGFILGLDGEEGAKLSLVLALLAGGAVASPVAAALVGRVQPARLGVAVGALLVAVNVRTVLAEGGVAGTIRWPVVVLVLAAGAWLAYRAGRRPADTPEQQAAVSA